ncbi:MULTISPECIES: hypothetical protein [unclassified Parafrankia]|uniref:hypothetical protein n=1 Tax=unclassified Parafrankia TaxID=2994368 RepID=UPI00140436EA|nr:MULTISPECIES: hypothetical protein [unclassified Parafrankia]
MTWLMLAALPHSALRPTSSSSVPRGAAKCQPHVSLLDLAGPLALIGAAQSLDRQPRTAARHSPFACVAAYPTLRQRHLRLASTHRSPDPGPAHTSTDSADELGEHDLHRIIVDAGDR